jgi:hypothetical protein
MNRGLRYLFLLAFGLGACIGPRAQELAGQDIAYFRKIEDSLSHLQKKVFSLKSDTARFRANARFLKLWDEILLNNLSFHYPFDSMKQVSRLVSPDKRVRIITWNLEKADGTHHFFGFLQAKNPKTNHYDLFELNDKSASIKNPEGHIGDHNKWFGMLYYEIIQNDDYYTLLGWDGNDKTVCRKFIDVLSFKSDGTPLFGKDVFKYPRKNPKRVMFEYSAKVVMSLRQYNGAIVFDHLAAKDEMNEGMPQFYGPDFSYDAFLPSKGRWVYEPDVDVKNPKSKNDNVKRKGQKEKPIYAPHN